MRTCGAPLNVHIQRLHIINCKKKTPIHMNGSFVFFLGRCYLKLLRRLQDALWIPFGCFGSTKLYSAGQSERAASSAITVQLV